MTSDFASCRAKSRKCDVSASAHSAATRCPAPSSPAPPPCRTSSKKCSLPERRSAKAALSTMIRRPQWSRRSEKDTFEGGMSHQSELIATDIEAYLAEHERKELLRFLTCGSV